MAHMTQGKNHEWKLTWEISHFQFKPTHGKAVQISLVGYYSLMVLNSYMHGIFKNYFQCFPIYVIQPLMGFTDINMHVNVFPIIVWIT